MRLNADIICDRLKRSYPIKTYGQFSTELIYSYPELYLDNTDRFEANHLYLATVEHLPLRPKIGRDAMIVCIGESPRLSYYWEHASVVVIRQKADFFQVYKALQDIFAIYQGWEAGLFDLMMRTPSIQGLLDATAPVLGCAVFVLNAGLQFVASSGGTNAASGAAWRQTEGILRPEDFLSYLRENALNMDRRGAFLLEFDAATVLCVNLFDRDDKYIGCLCIDQSQRLFIEGEQRLAEYLGRVIEKVAETNPVLLNRETDTMKEVYRSLISELPLGQRQRHLLRAASGKRECACLSIHTTDRFATFPVAYICTVFETLFAESAFFEYNNTILGIIPAPSGARDSVMEKLGEFAGEMRLCVGVSNDFSDLYLLRAYYHQAEAAIANGRLFKPGESVYAFGAFELAELISNALAGLPAETYLPRGLKALAAHDQEGGVSYLETLTAYLEENMSFSKTARRLYIHRSTLIERVERIRNELGMDLDDPGQRLLLEMLLKAMSLEKTLREQ